GRQGRGLHDRGAGPQQLPDGVRGTVALTRGARVHSVVRGGVRAHAAARRRQGPRGLPDRTVDLGLRARRQGAGPPHTWSGLTDHSNGTRAGTAVATRPDMGGGLIKYELIRPPG